MESEWGELYEVYGVTEPIYGTALQMMGASFGEQIGRL